MGGGKACPPHGLLDGKEGKEGGGEAPNYSADGGSHFMSVAVDGLQGGAGGGGGGKGVDGTPSALSNGAFQPSSDLEWLGSQVGGAGSKGLPSSSLLSGSDGTGGEAEREFFNNLPPAARKMRRVTLVLVCVRTAHSTACTAQHA